MTTKREPHPSNAPAGPGRTRERARALTTRPPEHRSALLHRRRRSGAGVGYLFISPWIVGFTALVLLPLAIVVYLSFTNYSLIGAPSYVGLQNYERAFFHDPLFWMSVRNTAFFIGLAVPIGMALSLLLALFLDQGVRGSRVLRTIFFLPSITPIVASVLIWRWLLQPEFGVTNYFLTLLHLPTSKWLGSLSAVKPALIIIAVWGSAGGARMLIFLAALQSIPRDLYEAAEVDGATRWRRFCSITLPLLTPALFFNSVIAVIDGLRVFTLAYVATEGGPANQSLFYMLNVFFNGFKYQNLGYASSLACILFVVALIFTAAQFRLQRRWVHYERGD